MEQLPRDADTKRTGMYLQRVMSEEQTSLLSYYLLLKRNEPFAARSVNKASYTAF